MSRIEVDYDIPNMNLALKNAVKETVEWALTDIQANAVLTAPVDTGFYRANIQIDLDKTSVVANAEYSAPIEYGINGTRRQPNPVMRNSAKKTEKRMTNELVRRFYSQIKQVPNV